MSSIVVVGSMAFDSIETPFGKVSDVLGGSANYFSIAASYFSPVQCVSVIGKDYPTEHLKLLKARNIDTEGVQVQSGKTFHWTGSYGFDLHEAKTLDTQLNVFEKFQPVLPASYRQASAVFLGNIVPELQAGVLSQLVHPKVIALDTMNFWIERSRDALIQVLSRCHIVIINESEARQLTQRYNIVQAAHIIQQWGPKILVVKRGEYGALLFDGDQVFSVPGLPLTEVKDPTGAGDSFAGGFMGYLASQKNLELTRYALRKAVVYGSVMASFAVQDFSFKELLALDNKKIEDRYKKFLELTTFHVD